MGRFGLVRLDYLGYDLDDQLETSQEVLRRLTWMERKTAPTAASPSSAAVLTPKIVMS